MCLCMRACASGSELGHRHARRSGEDALEAAAHAGPPANLGALGLQSQAGYADPLQKRSGFQCSEITLTFLKALGGYLKAAQVVVVAVDATELQAPHEAKQLLSKASEDRFHCKRVLHFASGEGCTCPSGLGCNLKPSVVK